MCACMYSDDPVPVASDLDLRKALGVDKGNAGVCASSLLD